MVMSKSLAADALLAAVDGGHVAVFADSMQDAREVMRWFVSEYPELDVVAEVIRANGRESMTFPGGGTLTFLPITRDMRGVRGWRLDRCYVPIGISRGVIDMIRPCLATSADGTLAGY